MALWGLPPRNQWGPLTRWPSANTASQRGGTPLLSPLPPSSLFCTAPAAAAQAIAAPAATSPAAAALIYRLQYRLDGGKGERRGVPPLWLAVLADGHLVRGPHWFLGGRPHSRVQWFWLFFTFWGITTHPWHPKGPRIWKLAKKIFQLHPSKNRKMRIFLVWFQR